MSLFWKPFFQNLDNRKEITPLINDQIKSNKYQSLINESFNTSTNKDTKAAPRPIGRNTINDPSVSSKNKKTTAIISQTW